LLLGHGLLAVGPFGEPQSSEFLGRNGN
jgi:hypothetical protein